MEQTLYIGYWWPIALVVGWCFFMILMNGASYLLSPSWRKLHRSYATTNEPAGKAFWFQQMEVGPLWGNVFKFTINDQSLFISTCPPFSCWSPVFEVPWREVQVKRDVYLFFHWGYEVEFGNSGAKAKFSKRAVKNWVPYVQLPQ